jgi:hypothetical protein
LQIPESRLQERAARAHAEHRAAEAERQRAAAEAERRRQAEALGYRLWHWLGVKVDPDGPEVEVEGLRFRIALCDGAWHLSLVWPCQFCGHVLESWTVASDGSSCGPDTPDAVLTVLGGVLEQLEQYDQRVRERGDARCMRCPHAPRPTGAPVSRQAVGA